VLSNRREQDLYLLAPRIDVTGMTTRVEVDVVDVDCGIRLSRWPMAR
jgi:hypothetical protein